MSFNIDRIFEDGTRTAEKLIEIQTIIVPVRRLRSRQRIKYKGNSPGFRKIINARRLMKSTTMID